MHREGEKVMRIVEGATNLSTLPLSPALRSSFDDMDLLEQRLADCECDFSDPFDPMAK